MPVTENPQDEMDLQCVMVPRASDALVITPLDPVLVRRAAKNAKRPRSESTARAYAHDWERFSAWCREHGLASMPAAEATVVLHLTLLAEKHAYATIARAYASIRARHVEQGSPMPTLPAVTNTLENIGRQLGTAGNGKDALMNDKVRAIAHILSEDVDDASGSTAVRMLAARDVALLTVGFASGSRRGELVGLDVADVSFEGDGLVLFIRKSKTDQRGQGRKVGVPFGSKGSCPVRAMRRWLDAAGIAEGAVFRTVDRAGRVGERLAGQGVERAVKRAVARIGLEPRRFGAHSLRAGLLSSAEKAGKSIAAGKRQTGHVSPKTAMKYIRLGSLFTANAADGLL
jgi:integrase